MHDGPSDVPGGTHLAKAVELCELTLGSAFDDYDRKAISQQKRHVRTVRVAALLGTFSILVTIAQLVLGGDLETIEVAAGVFAVIAVLLGLRAAFQKDWLLNRYRAERLRALKFSYLMGPASWNSDPVVVERARARLQDDVARIQSATFEAVDVWLQQIRVPTPPGPSEATYAMELDELRNYYRLKRLGKQGWFFYTRAAENERLNTFTSNLAQYVFFGGIVAALLHFGLQALGSAVGLDLSTDTESQRSNIWVPLSTFFVLAALALPVLSSCIRTIRGSREFARNRMRYYANYLMLVRLDQQLRHSQTHEEVLIDLYNTEQALEAELHEWLGLMREAEWYG
jgi:SMODS and SLOG-associating 2TM effector domain 3